MYEVFYHKTSVTPKVAKAQEYLDLWLNVANTSGELLASFQASSLTSECWPCYKPVTICFDLINFLLVYKTGHPTIQNRTPNGCLNINKTVSNKTGHPVQQNRTKPNDKTGHPTVV